jgi:hypothetical protein
MSSKIDAFLAHENTVAERYRWWGVYLIREQRRLQAIADAVQAEDAQQAVRGQHNDTVTDVDPNVRLAGLAALRQQSPEEDES